MTQTNREKEGAIAGWEMLLIVGIFLLIVHFFWYCSHLFIHIPLATSYVYPLLAKFHHEGSILANPLVSKTLILLWLLIYSAGSRGVLDPNLTRSTIAKNGLIGMSIYIGSILLLYLKKAFTPTVAEIFYILCTIWGTALLIKAGQLASRLFFGANQIDTFNKTNEEFPQNEQLIESEDLINFRHQFHYRNKWRVGFINLYPYRASMVLGVPGSGKSFSILIQALWQSIFKGFTIYAYDFKFPDLTEEAYNAYLMTIQNNPWAWTPKSKRNQPGVRPIIPTFWVINLDDIEYSHRCNPLDPVLLTDIMDANELAKTIMLNLNKSWAEKQGEYFPESAINYLTAIIWYLRTASVYFQKCYDQECQKEAGNPELIEKFRRLKDICTFPHVLEIINKRYDDVFPILEKYPEVEIYARPFIDAMESDVMEQLEGQISSVRIPIARMASPTLYWVMTGKDFTLDINNSVHPKILCTGNNPKRQGIYGAAFSLYTSQIIRLINEKHRLKCALFWDEFPTIYIQGIESLIATGRSNLIAVWLGIQDFAQLFKGYGKKDADVIMGIMANLFTGTVVYETAEKIAKRFGRINQQKVSMTYSKGDTTVNVSEQQADMIPASKLSTLNVGEMAGQFADSEKTVDTELKSFKGQIYIEKEVKKQVKLPILTDISILIDQMYALENEQVVEIGDQIGPIEYSQLSQQEKKAAKRAYVRINYPSHSVLNSAEDKEIADRLELTGWADMPFEVRQQFLAEWQRNPPTWLDVLPRSVPEQDKFFKQNQKSFRYTLDLSQIISKVPYSWLDEESQAARRLTWLREHSININKESARTPPQNITLKGYRNLLPEKRQELKNKLLKDKYDRVKDDVGLLISTEHLRLAIGVTPRKGKK